jgi:regulator of replication initiation timing
VFLLQIEVKLEDIENNNSQLGDLKQQLASLIQECEQLYSVYEERRSKVGDIKIEFCGEMTVSLGMLL